MGNINTEIEIIFKNKNSGVERYNLKNPLGVFKSTSEIGEERIRRSEDRSIVGLTS